MKSTRSGLSGILLPGLLVVPIVLLLAVGAVAPAPAAKSSGGDFSLCCTTLDNPGFVIRGGLESCSICDPNTDWEPRYYSCGFSSCGYNGSWIVIEPIDGFKGFVTLEILNLPPGVTSQTASRVRIDRFGSTITPFKLHAATDAALGDFVVTVRATSGEIVHTNDELIRVADALPPDGP